MNTLFNKLTPVVGLLLSISFVSCQENNLAPADKPTVATTESVNELINPGLPKKYTLIKQGQATLTYYGDGRLQKVTYGPGPVSYLYDYVYYTYGVQSIKATYYGGSTVVQEELYLLDNSGRCTESKETTFTFYSFGTVVFETSFLYQYNALGQLKTRANKANAADRTDYTFNAAGNLSKATTYNANNMLTKDVTLAYDQPVGDPILTDRYPLNPEWVSLSDPYLKIFGKSSKHLVKLMTQKKMANNQVTGQFTYYFSYLLNPDGYVTEAKTFNVVNAALVSTKPYDYLITNIGLQL